MDGMTSNAETPIIIMKPPLISPAGFSKAGVDKVEIYFKAEEHDPFETMHDAPFVISCYRVYSALSTTFTTRKK